MDTLTATPQPPFFVPIWGAIPLGKLGVGTQIVTRAGPPLVIASLVRHEYPQGVPVYNVEVQGDHTYFVGVAKGGTWVHNDCLTGRQADAVRAIENAIADHLTEGPAGDIAGALRDTVGRPIMDAEGMPYQHLDEVKNAYSGLVRRSKALYGATDPRAAATRNQAMQMIRKLESLFSPGELGSPPFRGN